MNKLDELMQKGAPHLVIMYNNRDGKEHFQWGINGSIPVLTLLGAIIRIQAEVSFRSPEECQDRALVIVWDVENRKVEWFAHPSILGDSIIGMLETVKNVILNTHNARQASNQQVRLLGPDGKPFMM
jgi:hypothetical protein